MFSVFALILVASVSEVFTEPPGVLVLSFEGFHPDSMTAENTPNLYNVLQPIGAGPPYMRSVFPSKTYVTSFSLSTGVYPETHGIYGNGMFSQDNDVLPYGKDMFQKNPSLVPIWTENQNSGGERHSGVMMWPGSDFKYGDTIPTYVQSFNKDTPWEERADKIVEWMTSANDKANLVMAYFEDDQCHDKNLRKNHMKQHFLKIDNTINKIYTGLKTPITDGKINLIILSEHGTQEVEYEKVLKVEEYIDSDNVNFIVSGPLVFIKPITGFDDQLNHLSQHEDSEWKFKVFTKDTFEEHHKIISSHLIGIIVLVAVNGHTFMRRTDLENAVTSVGQKENLVLDENGYDIYNNKMNGYFLGIGKKFKNKIFPVGPFSLTDVYTLLKVLLELPNAASDDQNNLKLNSVVESILEEGVADSFKAHNEG